MTCGMCGGTGKVALTERIAGGETVQHGWTECPDCGGTGKTPFLPNTLSEGDTENLINSLIDMLPDDERDGMIIVSILFGSVMLATRTDEQKAFDDVRKIIARMRELGN